MHLQDWKIECIDLAYDVIFWSSSVSQLYHPIDIP